ncbi:hypothetical protein ACYRFS_13380 [Listeria kieliensis]
MASGLFLKGQDGGQGTKMEVIFPLEDGLKHCEIQVEKDINE